MNRSTYDQNKKIVIVDDEQELALLISDQLNILGFETEVYTNPMAASSYLRNTIDTIDLVISDIRMPNLPGNMLIKEIKDAKGSEAPPVIFITGHSDFAEEELLKLGAEMVLPKPFTLKILSRAIQETLAKNNDRQVEIPAI